MLLALIEFVHADLAHRLGSEAVSSSVIRIEALPAVSKYLVASPQ